MNQLVETSLQRSNVEMVFRLYGDASSFPAGFEIP